MTNYKKVIYELKEVVQKIQAGASIELISEKLRELTKLTKEFEGNDREVIISAGYWMVSLIDHADFFITEEMFSLVFNMLDRLAERGTFVETVDDEKVFFMYDKTSKAITETLHGLRGCFYENGYNNCQKGGKGYKQARQLKADIKQAKETQATIEWVYNDYVHGVMDASLAIDCMYEEIFL